jgi:hypothetical protein
MGIPGLLVALKSYLSTTTTTPTPTTKFGNNNADDTNRMYNGNIYDDFQNQAVAIDASSWFHKSVYSIADHYVECIEQKNATGVAQVDAKCISKWWHWQWWWWYIQNIFRNGWSALPIESNHQSSSGSKT